MGSFFKKFGWIFFCIFLFGGGFLVISGGDPIYFVQEQINRREWAQYNPQIYRESEKTGVDFLLIRAVIWQESRFGADKIGSAGERGLMQVTEAAAADWVKATNATDFTPEKLLDPATNIRIGTWYLQRALRHYAGKDHPLSFALTEYNAGRGRVKKWIGTPDAGENPMSADEMKEKSFESTRAYVESIEHRYAYYKKRSG